MFTPEERARSRLLKPKVKETLEMGLPVRRGPADELVNRSVGPWVFFDISALVDYGDLRGDGLYGPIHILGMRP